MYVYDYNYMTYKHAYIHIYMYTYIHRLHRSMSLFHYLTHICMYYTYCLALCQWISSCDFFCNLRSPRSGASDAPSELPPNPGPQLLRSNSTSSTRSCTQQLQQIPIQTAAMESSLCETRKVCGMRWGCTHHTDSHSTYFIWQVR